MKLKVGDRVRCIGKFDNLNLAGKTGTVVFVDSERIYNVGVDFDDSFHEGHSCGGKAKQGHGRYGNESELELLTTKEQFAVGDRVEAIDGCIKGHKGTKEKFDLPPEFAYIARDKDGLLFAYVDKPKRDIGGTQWYGERFKKINDSLLPDLKWTDEPYEV